MLLKDLIRDTDIQLSPHARAGVADIEITDLTDDSRQVTPGCLFIARPGTKSDGKKFIADALQRGAVAVLEEQGPGRRAQGPAVTSVNGGAVQLASPLLRPGPSALGPALLSTTRIDNALVARLAERFFGDPSRKLRLIGVTGTNGKTTITFVIQHLLARAGVKAGVIGTVVIDDGHPVSPRTPADLTTPGAIDLIRYLARMVKNGCQAAVMEVSSHALDQGRVATLKFDAAIFTNLTGDHLDYHKTMENYAAAKATLFAGLSPDAWAIVNADDAWSLRMLRDCKGRVLRCGIGGESAAGAGGAGIGGTAGTGVTGGEERQCTATILSLASASSRVRFDGPWGSQDIDLPMVGRHNAMNVLQATAAANSIVSLSRTLRESLATCPAPPGRLEPVRIPGDGAANRGDSSASNQPSSNSHQKLPSVLVDYAHTHDALENVLNALRPVTSGRVIVMFGCGGDRDRTKRPKMAAVCCRLADVIVITSDNPRTEDPAFIISQVLSGVPERLRPAGAKAIEVTGEEQGQGQAGASAGAGAAVSSSSLLIPGPSTLSPSSPSVLVEPDRAKAIRIAVDLAGPDDVVLLAGKGHEDYQIIGTTKRHFDDREEAAAALLRRQQLQANKPTGCGV